MILYRRQSKRVPTLKRHEGTFWGDGSVLGLDCCDYTYLYICQMYVKLHT